MNEREMEQWLQEADGRMPAGIFARAGGSLLMMIGLPGAGKSHLINHVQSLLPCIVVRSDDVRAQRLSHPQYAQSEKDAIYALCHALIARRLRRGQRVVFDATNHLRARRHALLEVAAQCGAAVAICHVSASEEATRQRLLARHNGARRAEDRSDAGWRVYQLLREQFEPPRLPHLALDSSATPSPDLARRLCDYWLACEGRGQ
ncbi:MAG: ATP-binding protein [Anaerolineales bacterium]|nr:ATP-binding protein [Anaerolineales bacterium]MCB8953128.1 ATP-binding protein [Ardenticatenales bacterium]